MVEYKGEEYHLDIDAILADEASRPGYSFFTALSEYGKGLRMTDIVDLCRYVGSDYLTLFRDRRLAIDDLPQIVQECLSEAGFRSAEPGQERSSEPTA